MFYFVLLAAVIVLLSVVAWFFPSRRHALAYVGAAPQAQPAPAPGTPGEVFQRLAKGQRKVDEPCLTPIDCVLDNHCDGHCGCR